MTINRFQTLILLFIFVFCTQKTILVRIRIEVSLNGLICRFRASCDCFVVSSWDVAKLSDVASSHFECYINNISIIAVNLSVACDFLMVVLEPSKMRFISFEYENIMVASVIVEDGWLNILLHSNNLLAKLREHCSWQTVLISLIKSY